MRRRLIIIMAGVILGGILSLGVAWLAMPPTQRTATRNRVVGTIRAAAGRIAPEMLARYDYRRGFEQARSDIAEGKLAVRTYGLRSVEFDKNWVDELSHYGVTMEIVAGCVVDEQIKNTTEGYNTAIKEELTAQFGVDVLNAAESRAYERIEKQLETSPLHE